LAPVRGQRFGDGGIAFDRAWFVVGIRIHRFRPEFGRQRGNDRACRAMLHDESTAKAAQLGVQLDQAGVDETYAAIVARQAGQDVGIEDEYAVDGAGSAQCMVQRGMVESAQVAPEPDQGLA